MLGYIEIAVIVFFLGAIPSAQVIASLHGDGDLKKAGSGNVGAANLARLAGRSWGALAGLCDTLKAFLPIYLFHSWGWITELDVIWLGAVAMTGHIFSPFINWRGGKGLSIAYGLLFLLQPWVFLPAALVGGLAYRLLGYVPGATVFFLLAYEFIAQLAALPAAAQLAPCVFGIIALLATVPDFIRTPRKLLPPQLRGESKQ